MVTEFFGIFHLMFQTVPSVKNPDQNYTEFGIDPLEIKELKGVLSVKTQSSQ